MMFYKRYMYILEFTIITKYEPVSSTLYQHGFKQKLHEADMSNVTATAVFGFSITRNKTNVQNIKNFF